MRKIINGKVYNSETAKLIASNCPTEGKSSLNRRSISIYKKRTSEYFILEEPWLKKEYFRAEIRPISQEEATCVFIQMLFDSCMTSISSPLEINYSDNLVKDAENILVKEIESYRRES